MLSGMLLMAVSAVPASATQPTPAGWPQNGLGADRTGYQPNETVINTSNVATLSESRTYESGQAIASAPLIWNGDLYDHIGNTLDAFDATGVTDCSSAPSTCTPLPGDPTNGSADTGTALTDIDNTDDGGGDMSTAYRLWCVSTPPTSPVTSSSQIADWGQLTNLGPSLLVYNARVTNGSYDISVNPDVVGSLPTFVAGDAISGTGIPSGTTVVSVSGSTAVLSKDATATGTPNLTITTTSKLAVGLGLPVGIPIRIMGINAAAGIESTFALYANSGGGTTSGGCASNMNTAASDPNPVTKLGTNASPHIALQNNSDQVDEFAAGDFPSPDYVDQAIEAATTLLVESNGDFNTDPYAGAATIDGTSYSGNKVEEDSYAPATPNLLQNHYPTAMTLFNVYRTDTIRASTGGFLNWICDSNTNFSKGLDQTTRLNYDAELSTTISSVYGFPRLTDTSAAPAVATPADGEPAPNNSCAASLPVTSTINADTVSLTGGGDFPVDIVNAGGLVGGASVGIVSADFPAGTKVVSGAGTSTLTLSADATTSGSATTVFSGVPEVTTVASPQT